jgi:hypothetical protein
MKYIQGPWSVEETKSEILIYGKDTFGLILLAEMFKKEALIPETQMLANAYAMAKVPELISLIRELMSYATIQDGPIDAVIIPKNLLVKFVRAIKSIESPLSK